MVSMHQRDLTFLCDLFCHEKGRKFTLGMYNIRIPLYNPAIQFASRGHPKSFGSLDFGNTLKAIWEEVTAAGEAAEGEYPMEVDFTGFCTGICVLSNVVMAKAFVPEARVCVIEKACACVTPQTHQTAIAAMGPIQADVI